MGIKKALQGNRAKTIDSRTNKRKYVLSIRSMARGFHAHLV
jgi:hypothetical protein